LPLRRQQRGLALEKLSPEKIKSGLGTAFMGQNVLYYPTIGSTNDVAKEVARRGAPEGTLVIAEEQTAGKGRLGRRWLAPPGTSLLMSLLFYPDLAPSQAQRLTMLCSLAVIEGIRVVTGLEPQLKWPNDILMNYKKVGGILTETGVTGDHLDYVVVGIGLNVNLEVSQAPEIAAKATSLWQELGRKVPRLRLLQEILKRIEGRYQRLGAGESPHEEWASSLITLGRRVWVTTPEGQEEGWAEGVDEDGALILRRGDGSTVLIAAGDVTLKAEMPSG